MPDFTAADLAYIRRDYLDLETACAQRGIAIDDARALIAARVLPRPAYVLDDGTEMVAPDHFALLDEAGAPDRVRAGFEERYRAAGGDPGTLDEEWDDYLSGVYAVCLKRVSPETIVRKTALVESLTRCSSGHGRTTSPGATSCASRWPSSTRWSASSRPTTTAATASASRRRATA
jgi:hypothetical protein